MTFLVLLLLITHMSFSQDRGIAAVNDIDIDNVLPKNERACMMNDWLEWRLDNILPDLMREEGIDVWLIINREWIEDPAVFTKEGCKYIDGHQIRYY